MSKLFSACEVAEMLGISLRTAQRMVAVGRFPNAFKAGAGARYRTPWRIPQSDVENYIKQQQAARQKEQRQQKH